MANHTSNVSFRIDTDVKNQADRLFAELGLTMTAAFNIFLRQAIREGAIPFTVTVNTPNAETVAARRHHLDSGRQNQIKGETDL
jgi:DNA-damage-inducible protein J